VRGRDEGKKALGKNSARGKAMWWGDEGKNGARESWHKACSARGITARGSFAWRVSAREARWERFPPNRTDLFFFFLLFIASFFGHTFSFLSKRTHGMKGRGRTGKQHHARDQERRGMAAVGDGGGQLGLKDNKKKTKERTQVTSNN
jgi:hypothetical protein